MEMQKEDRAWSFFVSVCMESLGGMRIVSFSQLFESSIQMVFSGFLGKIFDRVTRKQAIVTVVICNNLSIFLSSVLLIVSFSITSKSSVFPHCLVFAVLLYGVNRLFLNAEKSIVGKDWVVVLFDNSALSKMNAGLTIFDQFLNVIAPLATGALVAWLGLKTTLTIFAFGSVLSLGSKSFFLWRIYTTNEALRYKELIENNNENELCNSQSSASQRSSSRGVVSIYFGQKAFAAAFGMTLLYKTVMGFDGLAVGYASSVGLPVFTIGMIRSYGSFAGMMGAFSYAYFEKRYSVVTSGLLGLVVQQAFSILAVVSIWLRGSPMNLSDYFRNITFDKWWSEFEKSFNRGKKSYNISDTATSGLVKNPPLDHILVFLIAVASARYGLWCIDLTVTHIMQINTPERERNSVFGMHMALCQAFSVPKELLVMIFPHDSTFALYILSSYAFVTAGHILFMYYLVKSKSLSGKKLGKKLVEKNKYEVS